MDLMRLRGEQYVRLAPGVAERVARYLRVSPWEIDELAVELDEWPPEVQPVPRPAQGGRLIAGDPVLLDATDTGLIFSARLEEDNGAVAVPWNEVQGLRVLREMAVRYEG